MKFSDINFDPGTRELRVFSILWLVAFAALAGLGAWRGAAWAPAVGVVALAGGVVGLLLPKAMRWIYVGWMVAAFPVGWTVSLVLLALVYYGVFTAFGLVFRAIGRDALGRTFDRDATTYWVTRRQPDGVERYFRQF